MYANLESPLNSATVEEPNSVMKLSYSRRVITACLVISIGLHAALLIRFSGSDNPPAQQPSHAHSIELVLNKYTPQQPPLEEPVIAPQAEQPKQQAKPQTDPARTITSTKADTQTIQQATTEAEPKAELQAEPQSEDATPTASVSAEAMTAHTALLASEKQRYLEKIADHLNRYKFYPPSARRRHIQGAVQVSFELLQDGNIVNLQTFSGHNSLQKAAEEAIERSLPLPARPESLVEPASIKIEYVMQYSLKD